MKAPRPRWQNQMLRLLFGLGIAVLLILMVIAPIALGLHLMGLLPVPAGILYGLALPFTLLFAACLIRFPWDTKLILTVCTVGLFALSVPAFRQAQQKYRASHPAAQPTAAAMR